MTFPQKKLGKSLLVWKTRVSIYFRSFFTANIRFISFIAKMAEKQIKRNVFILNFLYYSIMFGMVSLLIGNYYQGLVFLESLLQKKCKKRSTTVSQSNEATVAKNK